MLFRNRRLARVTACYLLLQTIGSLVLPSVSLAMVGPSQPEFTSYEAPGATDLVNLTTGDFSYSIPLIDVPGPERSFSLPLSYKSGIQLEQEASWVGLGWSLNAGAIARTVNGYADDASGDVEQSHFYKDVATVQTTNYIPGVWSSTEELYSGKTFGSVDLLGLASANWDNDGIAGGDLVGISYQKGQGVGINPLRTAVAAATIATLGGAGVASTATNVGLAIAQGAATNIALGIGLGAFGVGRMDGVASFNNRLSTYEFGDAFGSDTYTLIANDTKEQAYGSLYFNKLNYNVHDVATAPTINIGGYTRKAQEFNASRDCEGDFNDAPGPGSHLSETVADVYQAANTGSSSASPQAPISVSHDYFSVMGEGASGAIRPYRLDVGSVVYPGIRTSACNENVKYSVAAFTDAKVGFRYENDISNTYDYHQNGADTGLKVSADKQSITITDQRLFDYSARTEALRKGLANPNSTGPQLIQGKHVVWYSNAELEAMTGSTSSGFIDFAAPVAGSGTSNTFRHQLPPQGIGGFAVTVEDGSTYYYALPVYQFKTYTVSDEVPPVAVGRPGHYYKHQGEPSAANPHGGYATTWLLTAITSPDYIDRNSSGTVDGADWGGWVKLEYGKFSSRYKWRQPYIGTSYSDAQSPIEYEGSTQGYKETYYLDRISTRTHTALFVKSVRLDSRGHFNPLLGTSTSNGLTVESELGISEKFPASSLRLDEVILLDNPTLTKLQVPNGIRAVDDPNSTTIPALSNNTNNNATGADCSDCGDDLGRVLDGQDLLIDSRIRAFIEANAIKRVRFNYGYDLCRGVPNAFEYQNGQVASLPPMNEINAATGRSGKLTLKSLSFFGPTINLQPTKIIPDFVFGYDAPGRSISETNPNYSKENWDAFGMYQPAGKHDITSHKPDPTAYAAPWTLTKITSPLGGTTTIVYERDQYAHVSEHGTVKVKFSGSDGTLSLTNAELAKIGGALSQFVKKDDFLELNGTIEFTCNHHFTNGGDNIEVSTKTLVNERVQVASVTDNTIQLKSNFGLSCGEDGVVPELVHGTLTTSLPGNVTGGDVRVANITTTDGEKGAQYEVRYKYTDGTNASYNSTGVVTKEPSFLDKVAHPTDNIFDYPTTPVLYGQVTVLRGPFKNNQEALYNSKEVYSFFTPTAAMVSEKVTTTTTDGFRNATTSRNTAQLNIHNNQVVITTGLIGRPKAVRTYNQQGQQELSTDFTYADQVTNADGIARQGHYSEGVLTTEMMNGNSYYINRTTKEYTPAVLIASRSTRNNLSISNSNVLYDFLTGQILETAFTNSLGKILHTRTIPAYTLPGNEGMGPKGDNSANKHMLGQMGAAYTYLEVPGGPTYNPLNPLNPATSHVLSASVQTWQSNWTNYREADANGTYQDVAGQQPVWRQAATYTWKSPVLDTDGSLKDFTPFNWTGPADRRWIKTGETVRYDHYSHAVEARDVNGQYAAQKTGYNQTQLVASASNARYTEVAFSGAEDQLPVAGTTHFGGEVVAGSGTAVSSPTHTGFYSLQVPSGQQGFLYRAQAGRDVLLGSTYRVSAWANANATSGTLYASLNGKRLAQSTIASPTTKKAGAWYLLSLLVTIPASANGQPIEFGCANEGATAANFDDFRVAPLTSTMTSRVYDPRTNLLLYSLDNDNLFTRYEYTPTGRLKRVYQETLDGTGNSLTAQKLMKEYDYNYALLSYPTWISTLYTCATDGDGNYNGLELRQEVDINPLSSRTNSPRWVVNGESTVCTPPVCDLNNADVFPVRMRNNICEKALPDNSNPKGAQETLSCYSNGRTGHLIKYHWIWPNNTPAPDTYSDCIVDDGPIRTN